MILMRSGAIEAADLLDFSDELRHEVERIRYTISILMEKNIL